MSRANLVPVVVVSAVLTGAAQSPSNAGPVLTEEPQYQSICQAAVAQPLPAGAAALATAGEREAAGGTHCDEVEAYYGFGKPPDYAVALRCAYEHRAKPRNDVGSFVDGPGTLSMLYANGYGVPRNYTLAIRFACELNGSAASAETELRIGRLEALRDGRLPATKPFDLCDDATSGALGSYCEFITQKLADVGRARRLEALRRRLPESAQERLPGLQAAETAFEKARGQGEYTGGGGTGSAGFVELDQGQLREQFLINLERFAAGHLPRASAEDRARAEWEMQHDSAAAQAKTETPGRPDLNLGVPEPDKAGLIATQLAWQALFAAWMRFVPIAYPHLSANAAATELLRLRIHQLKHLGL